MAAFEVGTLDAATRTILEAHRFDAHAFGSLRDELRAGRYPKARNVVTEPLSPATPSDLTPWPEGDRRAALIAQGAAAIAQGRVAVLVLNGGMATRFGGVVKGVVEVSGGESFLGKRLRQVAAAGPVPIFLMNSFATDATTRAHLREHAHFGVPAERVHPLIQRVSLRLTPNGDVFEDATGRPSLYAPGHGDVFEVLAESPAYQDFVARGGLAVMIGNVDNLGATLSPLVIGVHLAERARKPVTVEVAARWPGDAGGAPMRRGGRLEIIEGFRLPADFDAQRLQVFNTNTLTLDATVIRADYELSWFRADKEVDGRPAVQFERLLGEVTRFVDATYLEVPRQGEDNRFVPVKSPADLERLRASHPTI